MTNLTTGSSAVLQRFVVTCCDLLVTVMRPRHLSERNRDVDFNFIFFCAYVFSRLI